MKKISLIKTHLSAFGKHNSSVLELSLQTSLFCLEGIDKKSIDLLVFTSFAPENYTSEYHLAAKLADRLGLRKDIFCIRTETASSSGASALHTAIYLLRTGKFKNALVVGTEIMSRFDREKNNLLLGSVLSDTQRGFAMSMAQGAALLTNRYLHQYKYSKDDLFYIAEKLHSIGAQNPKAHIQKKITKEDYFSAPIFSYPLGLYDISPLSDGSCAIMLSTSMDSDMQILGIGSGRASFSISEEPSFPSSVIAFHEAYKEANLKPSDIQIAELHDAFTPFEVIGAEDAGLFAKGEALQKIVSGITHPDGQLPVNASGGLKTRGHPIGASGLAQIAELCRLMNQKNKNIGLAHSIGGLATNNFATILEKTK